MATQTAPRICPNCNRATKYNTTGKGAPRYCTNCGWGMDTIKASRVLKPAKKPPAAREIIIACWILAPIIIIVPYILVLKFANDIEPAQFTAGYLVGIVILTAIGFVFNPAMIGDNVDADHFQGHFTGQRNLRFLIMIYIVFLPGAITATAIKGIFNCPPKRKPFK
ncbi:hypothetical protein JD969_12070 [Planctomycetota bacterium]|nr:hypothetical protein JD969_12070 [Planctomycetota bacterium]